MCGTVKSSGAPSKMVCDPSVEKPCSNANVFQEVLEADEEFLSSSNSFSSDASHDDLEEVSGSGAGVSTELAEKWYHKKYINNTSL